MSLFSEFGCLFFGPLGEAHFENVIALVFKVVIIKQLFWFKAVLWCDPLNKVLSHRNSRLAWLLGIWSLSLRARVQRYWLVHLNAWFLLSLACLVLSRLISNGSNILFVIVKCLCNIYDNHSDIFQNAFFVLLVHAPVVDGFTIQNVLVDVL